MHPEPVQRDECGFWTHSAYPEWDEGTTASDIKPWEEENGIRTEVVWFEDDAPEDVIDRCIEDFAAGCSDWNPSPPGPGAFLLSIHDTEDGPVAIFAIPNSMPVVEGGEA
ncbi:hypothetical protein H9C73_02970 [Marinobacterium sp. AK62]|uniref:Uncharacterized protein n=1 Tax=Marinobacterium alkalitolerans TaxID=1542925 RepID=A0ABS3Z7V8_9GAMM|nr:hypothetical protein [Marinobacterium alkalitolerans]